MNPTEQLDDSIRYRPRSIRSFMPQFPWEGPLFLIFATVALSACGIRVPDLEEIRNGPGTAQTFEQVIVHSIHCSIKDAVDYVKNEDTKLAPANQIDRTRDPFWFDKWGIQATMTLTAAEKPTSTHQRHGYPAL